MSLPLVASSVSSPSASSDVPFRNRFHVATLAFLRAKQLQAGAKPRVPWRGDKNVTLALREVLADTISWSVE